MKALLLLCSLSLLSACQSVSTPVTPLPPPANAAQLLQATEFRTPLLYLEAPLYDPEVQEWIPQQFLDEVQQAIQSTVNNPYTDSQLQQVLAKKLSAQEMQAVIDFYQSSAGQHILAAERSFRERINLKTETTNTNTSQALLTATQLNAALNRIFMASADSLIHRLDSYDCLALMQIPGSNLGLNVAKRNKARFMQRQIRRSLANVYNDISPTDAEAYLNFAQSEVGKKYFGVRVDALATTGQDFGERVAEAIAPGLPSCVGSLKLSPST